MMSDHNKCNSIDTFLEYFAREDGDKIFIFDLKQKLSVSYKKANELVNSLCSYFQKQGFKTRDTITLFLDNSLEMVLLLLASFNDFKYF